MDKTRTRNRTLKKHIRELLSNKNQHSVLKDICCFPQKQVVNPLISLFCSNNELESRRAITALGIVVSNLAIHHMESARIIMRRLMWSLNDESGGIGWGAPEAMGEIMANHEKLADEYHHILISYIMPDGNFIEHEMLQNGVLWGIGRLAHSRPHLFCNNVDLLTPYLESQYPSHRGLAAWVTGKCHSEKTKNILMDLKNDTAEFQFYSDWHIKTVTVGDMVY